MVKNSAQKRHLTVVTTILAGLLFCVSSNAALVTQTIFFNAVDYFPSGVAQYIPTASVSGSVAFTYDDAVVTIPQDNTLNMPSLSVDAVNLKIANPVAPGGGRTYSLDEVRVSLLISSGGLQFTDTLGPTHGPNQGTDGFTFLVSSFNDLSNINFVAANYTVTTEPNGLWATLNGSASTVLGNQVPVPIPGAFWLLLAGAPLLRVRG